MRQNKDFISPEESVTKKIGLQFFAAISANVDLYAKFTEDTRIHCDLTQLAGWADLAAGQHTITVKAKASGYIDSEPSTGVTVTKGVTETLHCLVAGYGNQDPTSVTFTDNTIKDWTPETVTQDGTSFIKIPTMYRKIVATSGRQITSFRISNAQVDSEYKPYSIFIDESGNLLPYVLIAKDWMSTSRTIGNGRTQARAKGTGYQLYDWQFQKLWQDLICAKMQTVNINSGSGITTDVLGLNWGYTVSWIDGVSYQGSTHKWAICYHPSKYADQATSSTTDYQLVSYTSDGKSEQEIMTLGYDASNEFFNYPVSTTSNSSHDSYYCDGFYSGTSATHPVLSHVSLSYALNGAFTCNASDGWSASNGVRLCYRPL